MNILYVNSRFLRKRPHFSMRTRIWTRISRRESKYQSVHSFYGMERTVAWEKLQKSANEARTFNPLLDGGLDSGIILIADKLNVLVATERSISEQLKTAFSGVRASGLVWIQTETGFKFPRTQKHSRRLEFRFCTRCKIATSGRFQGTNAAPWKTFIHTQPA